MLKSYTFFFKAKGLFDYHLNIWIHFIFNSLNPPILDPLNIFKRPNLKLMHYFCIRLVEYIYSQSISLTMRLSYLKYLELLIHILNWPSEVIWFIEQIKTFPFQLYSKDHGFKEPTEESYINRIKNIGLYLIMNCCRVTFNSE